MKEEKKKINKEDEKKNIFSVVGTYYIIIRIIYLLFLFF